MFENIVVVGLGNVGLGLSVALANRGFRVTGVDINADLVGVINKGINPSADKSISPYLRTVVRKGLMRCTTQFGGVRSPSFIFVTVGTPPGDSELGLNLGPSLEACKSVGSEILSRRSGYPVISIRSTLPFGASEILWKKLEESSGLVCGKHFGFCYNPEMLALGTVLNDIYNPDFIVVGEFDSKSGRYLSRFYREFLKRRGLRIVRTNPPTAEMIKLVCNAFLTTKITFANSVAEICEGLRGVDAADVLTAAGLDRRIGASFFRPGMSFGGQCFPKDLDSFILLGKRSGLDVSLFEAVKAFNDMHSYAPVKLAKGLLGELGGRTVSVLGLAYKAGISDTRDSPSLKLIEHLLSDGARIKVYDPNVSRLDFEGVEVCSDVRSCLAGSDCCIVTTREPLFRQVSKYLNLMNDPVIVDMVRLFDPGTVGKRAKYAAVGLGSVAGA